MNPKNTGKKERQKQKLKPKIKKNNLKYARNTEITGFSHSMHGTKRKKIII